MWGNRGGRGQRAGSMHVGNVLLKILFKVIDLLLVSLEFTSIGFD
jgi:hypothetical protein